MDDTGLWGQRKRGTKPRSLYYKRASVSERGKEPLSPSLSIPPRLRVIGKVGLLWGELPFRLAGEGG